MSEASDRRLWERLPNEPESAYARFLVYRNLGLGRTLHAAYGAVCRAKESQPKVHLPINWKRESKEHRWPERARAWDVFVLLETGNESVKSYVKLIALFAKNALESLEDGKAMKPMTFDEAVKALDILSKVISKEAIDAFFARLKCDLESAEKAAVAVEPAGD